MITKYAVMVKALSLTPYTESVEDTLEDAWEKRRFLEACFRGARISIEKYEIEEEENYVRDASEV